MRAGAEELTLALREEIARREADSIIHTTRTRCNGRCHDKCVVIDYPKGVWYRRLTPDDASDLIELVLKDDKLTEKVSHMFDGKEIVRGESIYSGVQKSLAIGKRMTRLEKLGLSPSP